MALRVKVLRTKAAKAEQKEVIKHKLNPERVYAFNEMLHNVYVTRRPKPSDYDERKDLVRVFNEMAKELYGNSNVPVVVEFGSFSMNIFDSKSDLDLSVNFGNGTVQLPRDKRIQTLRKFAKKLYSLQKSGHVTRVLPITTAKVPILKAVDCGTGVECDISIENWDGISKSRIIYLISLIDDRFPKLSFLMKAWARAHNINSSKDKTLNSLSIVLLVAFHLQTRNPPILPPFSALLKDGSDPEPVKKLCRNFTGYGSANKETLGELFVSLLLKLSAVEILWSKGLCASAYEGSWASKTWDSKVGCISVEDFTDRSQNVARAVGANEVNIIYTCIKLSVRHLSAYSDGQIEGSRLIELLFSSNAALSAVGTSISHTAGGKGKKGKGKKRRPILSNHVLEKRPPPADIWGGTSTGSWNGAPAGAEQHSRPIPSNSFLEKRPDPVDSWRGTSTSSWIGAPVGAEQETRPMLSNSGFEKRQRPVDSWGGTSTSSWIGAPSGAEQEARPILSNSGLEKRQRPVDSWGGTSTSSWIGAPAGAEQETRPIISNRFREKRPHPVDSWGGTSMGSWIGAPAEAEQETKPILSSRVLEKRPRPVDSWGGTSTGSWIGAPAETEQETRPILSNRVLEKRPCPVDSWGGTSTGSWIGAPLGAEQQSSTHLAGSWRQEPIGTKQHQSITGWGVTQQHHPGAWNGRVVQSGPTRPTPTQQASSWARNADVQQARAALNHATGRPYSSVPPLQQSISENNHWVPPSKRRR